MITLSPDVGYILRQLLSTPRHTKIFHPIWGDGLYHQAFATHNLFQTGICQDRKVLANSFPDQPKEEIEDTSNTRFYDSLRRVEANARIELFHPLNKFHYGFVFNNFTLIRDTSSGSSNNLRAVSPQIEDSLLAFECSKSSISQDRAAPEHLMTAEQMFKAALPGGYFASVMPRRWIGSNMKYAKWWNDNVATVARVLLPPGAVSYDEAELEKVQATPDAAYEDPNLRWELVVWMKPVERRMQSHPLIHAEFRYASFIYTIHEMGDTDNHKIQTAAGVRKAFRRHDWWQKSVKLWLEMLESRSSHMEYGTVDSGPVDLADPSLTRIFKPSANSRPTFFIAESLSQIENDPFGIHIKPGPPVRVRPYNPVAIALWHDMETGTETINVPASGNKPAKVVWKFSYDLRRKHFSDYKEELVKSLLQKGLRPYILRTDLNRLKKQNKWLAINLTPIERCVRMERPDPADDSKRIIEWDWMYSDMGLRATHPELWKMWEGRARKMKINKIAFEFQFYDLITMVCHQSILNSNVMGLGKTFELLILQLLRGCKQGLYVVPSKLLGVWQDEIEGNISRFVQMAKRNWRGERLYADYQIIEWGEQTLPSKLKTFNLISYEKLSAIPRDSLFFKCPKCDYIVSSPRRKPNQPCPNPKCDNFNRQKKCKQINEARGLRKFKERGPDGQVRVIDDRVLPGALVMMEELKVREKRMTQILVGYDYTNIPDPTDPSGVKTIKVSFPIYREEEKDVHLKWTFSELLRNAFNYVGVDEAVNVKNPDALRTKALNHLCPRHRSPATGTPIRGYPASIVSLMNWTFKRAVFPDYRAEDRGSLSRFMDKYGTKVQNLETRKWKVVPKANNPEQLQAELAPLMLRHIREEPNVVKDIPPKRSVRELIPLVMDDEHREFYQKWLDQFIIWYKKKKEEEGKGTGGRNEIMIKMGYLRNASSIPHAMFDSLTKRKKKDADSDAEGAAWAAVIGPYKGPPTQKQLWTRKLILAIKQGGTIELPCGSGEVLNAADHSETKVYDTYGEDNTPLLVREKRTLELTGGEKAMAFSLRRANLDAGQAWAATQKKPPIYSMIVDGRVPNTIQASGRSRKSEMITQFCQMDYDVMWAGLTALAEGHNIPCANHAIMMDYSWEPSDHRQGVGRMLRPQQENIVNEYYPAHFGTIEDYMAALCILKGKSMDEVVDYMDFEDFGVKLIPDIKQYAQAIVDGTEHIARAEMWLAAEEILKKEREGSYDEE